MMERDPYSLVYDAHWMMLESCAHFTRLVREGNRIKFSADGSRDPIKNEVQAADMPEVRIIARAGHPRQKGSSGTVWKQMTYEIQVSTGEKQFDCQLFPVVWAIDVAMAQWSQERWKSILWKGHAFVVHAVPRSASPIGAGQTFDQTRSVKGWSTALTNEVEMSFPEKLLKEI